MSVIITLNLNTFLKMMDLKCTIHLQPSKSLNYYYYQLVLYTFRIVNIGPSPKNRKLLEYVFLNKKVYLYIPFGIKPLQLWGKSAKTESKYF